MSTVWQVAAGSDGRNYSEWFLRHGMLFLGGPDSRALQDISEGDLILLKLGTSQVLAVGRAVSRDGVLVGKDESGWLDDFDGWNLSHFCNVEWHLVPPDRRKLEGLVRGTLKRSWQTRQLEFAATIMAESAPTRVQPPPRPPEALTDEQLIESMVARGLRAGAAEELAAALRRVRRLANFYYGHCRWEDLGEHEIRSFLILPLLLALGWAEQHIKIELPLPGRQRADIVCFDRPIHENDAKAGLILESKNFSSGLDYAPAQGSAYADHLPSCRTMVVSNGYCYKVFERASDGAFSRRPTAYLNVILPRLEYPLDPENVRGAEEALRIMCPAL